MKNPNDYRYIRAWGLLKNKSQAFIDMEQRVAAQEDAPLDAVYRLVDPPGQWRVFNDLPPEHPLRKIKFI